jgi:hypothetical protein
MNALAVDGDPCVEVRRQEIGEQRQRKLENHDERGKGKTQEEERLC